MDSTTLQRNTIEPGSGSVRIENMVVVRNNGCDNLTNHKRRLEID